MHVCVHGRTRSNDTNPVCELLSCLLLLHALVFFRWLLLLYIGNGVRSRIVIKQSGSFSKLFSKSCIQN